MQTLRVRATAASKTLAQAQALKASTSPRAAAAREAWRAGVDLSRQGSEDRALAAFTRAVSLDPGNALYWTNLANTQRRLRRTEDAIESARRAFELDGSSEVACHLLAEMLRLGNRNAEALRTLRALDTRTARSVQHWMMEGATLMALREDQEAALVFLQVLTSEPAHIEAYLQLGFALANLKRFSDAAECFRTVTLLEPDHLGAAVYAAHYADWACDWQQGADDKRRLREAMELQRDDRPPPSFSPFCLLSMSDDAALHRRAASFEARRIAESARARAAWEPCERGPQGYPMVVQSVDAGRIRVGFVSADFRTHATSMLLVRTLERLDRSRFEVFLFSHGADDGTALRRRMEAACDHFVDCQEMSTSQQAARIRDEGIAVLVDMSGYTAATRLPVFALRPAPVQVLWLAYPGTIGGDFIDYVIGDPVLTPLEHQDDFAECIAQLPVCYEPTDELREHPSAPTRSACGLPEEAFVFACFNQSYKITDEVFSRWCRILHRVPGSVLWLLVPQAEIRTALLQHAAERGIPAERMIFAPFVTPTEHLARLQCADLFLDTFPYGAHTTCSDALWMGLPVLTQVGRSFSARVAASLLNAAGLPELVADTADAYEDMAVHLAQDGARLAALRVRLSNERLRLPLFDNARFTLEWQALVERMVARWRAAEVPGPLSAR